MHTQLLVRIGKRLRELRKQKGIRLHELAEAAQVSKGLLSRIENGRTIPSLPVLLSIVQALHVPLSDFFEGLDAEERRPYIHCKPSEYIPFEKEEAVGFLYHSILNAGAGPVVVEAVLLDLEPGSRREPVSTDGYEFKYMLRGEVEYQLGKEKIIFKAGESLFFDGTIPHVPSNHTNQTASMLVLYLLFPSNGHST